MPNQYFEGNREVANFHEDTVPGRSYFDVSVSRCWDICFRSSCACGESKEVTITAAKGISTQIYNKSDLDISASLGFGLASISSKVSKESGESLTISTEQTVEDKTTIRAPECGRKTITIYQLVTKWSIKYFNSKGFFKKRSEVKHAFDVRENQYHYDYEVVDPVSECGCQPKVSYNALVQLEAKNASIVLPCNVVVDRITMHGIENRTFSKGDTIRVAELQIEIPKFLYPLTEEEAEILAYYQSDIKPIIPEKTQKYSYPTSKVASIEMFKIFSNPIRRQILRKLDESNKGWSNMELATTLKKNPGTITNNVRQLQQAGLVESTRHNLYITLLGKLQVEHIQTTSFFMKKGEYFNTHRVKDLPDIFRLSMVKLQRAELIEGNEEIGEKTEKIISNSVVEKEEKYVKAIKTYVSAKHIELVASLIDQGLKYITLLPENVKGSTGRDEAIRRTGWNQLVKEGKIEHKMVKENNINLILNEKEALICFPDQHGLANFDAALYCDDEHSLAWCKDLFQYWWDRGEKFDESKIT